MTKNSKLDIFKVNDSKKLYKITLKLFNDGLFNCFLSSQQFTLLDVLLNGIPDENEKFLIWDAFINSKLYLNFEEVNNKTNNKANNKVNENSESSSKTNDPSSVAVKKEEDLSNNLSVGGDTEVYLKSGFKSSRRLCSTVRYLLYEKAVDYIYDNKPSEEEEALFSGLENVLNDEDDKDEEHSGFFDAQEKINEEQVHKSAAVRDEEDDFDDDDDDDEENEDDKKGEIKSVSDGKPTSDGDVKDADGDFEMKDADSTSEAKAIVQKVDENGQITVAIPLKVITAKPNFPTPPEPISSAQEAVGNMVHPILGTSSAIESSIERKNELKLMKNFNKVYHTFENDLPNIVKRRKLERSDKQLEMINGKKDDEEEEEEDRNKVNKLMSLGGAANLSLKNLFGRIEEQRDKLQITDLELKNLIMDVRKNRSKWASYNKIGQEELYEACEKVVLELRGYTEHSTAFLNRVSKRDAPNYYQIIKKPMDLNTVWKKLKTFQYKSKQEFVDDLMLIWKNCLTYNSDPSHYIRTDAFAMQKKTLTLIPLIPEITIRDRAEVEKEAAMEAAAEHNHEEDNNKPGNKSTRGVGGANASKKAAKKGRSSATEVDAEEQSIEADTTSMATPVPAVESVKQESETPAGISSPASVSTTNAVAPTSISEATAALIDRSNLDTNGNADGSGMDTPGTGSVPPEDDENDDDNADDAQVNGGIIDDDDGIEEEEDLEMQTWKTLTSNTRYKLCVRRTELLKDNKIQPNEEALFRDTTQMSNFSSYLNDDSEIVLHRNRRYFDENDDPYLLEYDISGGLPSVKYPGVDDREFENIQNQLVDQMIKNGQKLDDLPPSKFMTTQKGSELIIRGNISIMQDIRNICAKINIIRQMKTQQFIHHTQMVAPKIERINEQDIDPLSKLPIYDQLTSEVSFTSLRRSVSQIAMANGFESTDPFCANILTQLAETYLSNLASSLKLHMESNSINKIPIKGHSPVNIKDLLLIALADNGISKPDMLYAYAKEHLSKQRNKLVDLKAKLENFLRELLRPTFQDLSEKSFGDDSEQFLNGDFSNEIGEDFFGFRELGLDKEFGLLTSTIPLHLLHSRLNNAFASNNSDDAKAKYEDFEEIKFAKITKGDIHKQIGLIQPFLKSLIKKSEMHHLKNQKRNEEEEKLPEDKDDIVLIEDDDLPPKQRNNRPRIPPTGKISGVKRRFIATAFFLDKQDEEQKALKEKESEEKEKERKEENGKDEDLMSVDQDASVDDSKSLDAEVEGSNGLLLEVIGDGEVESKDDSKDPLSVFSDDETNLFGEEPLTL